jgi:WD40 repeat protein
VIEWNPKTMTEVTTLSGPLGQAQNAAINATGTTLYTASLDGVMLAWDLTRHQGFGYQSKVGAPLPCCDPVSPRSPPLALSPDGTRFAVPLGPSTIGLFSTQTLQRQTSFGVKPSGDVITALAWSPTGTEIAVAGHDGLVQLWNVDGTPRLMRSLTGLGSLTGLPEAIQLIAFSPNGTLIAASDDNETNSVQNTAALPLATLAVWRADTGALELSQDLRPGNGPGGSDVVAFSKDGKLLAVSLLHGGVLVLDPATGQLLRGLSDPGEDTISLAFARDGTLAAGTLAGTVELWNAATGQREAPPLVAAAAPIADIAFDPTGTRFATSGYQDGAVKLWFTSTLQQEGPALPTDPGATAASVFEPDGSGLLAVDDLGDDFAWPTSLIAWDRHACAVAARNLTRQEWARYVPELPYSTVCP